MNLRKAYDICLQELTATIASLGMAKAPKVVLIDEQHCDTIIALEGYGLNIFIYEDEEDSPLIGKRVQRIKYAVQSEDYNPGVYRYADGSGEPPSVDVVEVLVTTNVYEAIRKIILMYVEQEINFFYERQRDEYEAQMEAARQSEGEAMDRAGHAG